MKTIVSFVAVLAICCTKPTFAHHGSSEFDLSKELRYQGTIVEHLWKNPHILTKLATTTADGQAITLEIEGASPSVLRVGGFTADSLKVGDQVTAVVSLSKRHPTEAAYGYELIKADGTVVPLVSARLKRPQVSQTTTSIFGSWVPTAESFSKLTRSLGSWPLTDKGRELRSQFTPVASGQARCVPVSAPMLMTYPVVMQFTQASDHVLLNTEWLGATRTIYTDGRNHPAEDRFQQGHSVGHWEGKVLTVDTTNFTDQETGGIPSGRGRHLSERFSLNDDGNGLHYEYSLEDPEFLSAAVAGTADMSYRPDMKLAGVECDTELAQRFFKEFK